ncbi:MAG: OadG-related small transporter subunit [Terrimicrobiaceae bacterium]
MNNLTFGITMLIVGMGGTLATLGLITLVIYGLSALFPVRADDKKQEEKK